MNHDVTEAVGELLFKQDNLMPSIFKVDWKDVLGAAVLACLVAVLSFLVDHYASIAFFVQHPIIAVGLVAAAASLLKSLLTTSEGKFAGVFSVK